MQCVNRDEIISNIQEIAKYAVENNIPVMFLIHPIFEPNNNFDNYSLVSVHQDLSQLAEANGLITIDLYDVFKPYEPSKVSQDVWHPNRKGHRLIAHTLYNYLETSEQFGRKLLGTNP